MCAGDAHMLHCFVSPPVHAGLQHVSGSSSGVSDFFFFFFFDARCASSALNIPAGDGVGHSQKALLLTPLSALPQWRHATLPTSRGPVSASPISERSFDVLRNNNNKVREEFTDKNGKRK
jgi:hypothetical protein